MKVSNIIAPIQENQTVKSDDLMRTVVEKLQVNHTGAVCVIDEQQQLRGIITDGDVRRIFFNSENATLTTIFATLVDAVATTNVSSIKDDETLRDALNLMVKLKIGALPVVSTEGKVIAVITEKQLLDYFLKEMNA